MPLSPKDKEDLKRDFQSKLISVSKDPVPKELSDGQLVWVKLNDHTKLLKVMDEGKLKQLYVDENSRVVLIE